MVNIIFYQVITKVCLEARVKQIPKPKYKARIKQTDLTLSLGYQNEWQGTYNAETD